MIGRERGAGSRVSLVAMLGGLLAVQVVSAGFFLFKLLADLFGFPIPILPWEVVELLEILASIGMLAGVVFSAVFLRVALRRMGQVERRLEAAAGDVQSYVDAQFREWDLTQTERDVALLVVKGFSNGEIAKLRGTSESTTKSQVSSIFRKAGLNSRQQLVTMVVEDLFDAIDV
ncbi:helix-turn-helix transcriptional regulator [Rhodobacterales bacterium HKCCE2091]|nr:helix-turn-helix transcriptional regulator [Rhodobacterales bacterium HKCCE2091]